MAGKLPSKQWLDKYVQPMIPTPPAPRDPTPGPARDPLYDFLEEEAVSGSGIKVKHVAAGVLALALLLAVGRRR